MRSVCPALMAEPLLASPLFRSTVMVVVAVPLWDDQLTWTHWVCEAAVQLHRADAVSTRTTADTPTATTDVDEGVMVNRQGAASCAIATVVSFTVRFARRVDGSTLGFAR